MIDVVLAEQGDIDLAGDIAFQRGPARFRAEKVEDQPVEAGHDRQADEDLFRRLQPKGQEAAQDVAHGDTLQYAEDAVVLDPVGPVLAEGPTRVVRRGGVEGEEVQ